MRRNRPPPWGYVTSWDCELRVGRVLKLSDVTTDYAAISQPDGRTSRVNGNTYTGFRVELIEKLSYYYTYF
jgi:hypothetical protein